jgi:hypothetical protein
MAGEEGAMTWSYTASGVDRRPRGPTPKRFTKRQTLALAAVARRVHVDYTPSGMVCPCCGIRGTKDGHDPACVLARLDRDYPGWRNW